MTTKVYVYVTLFILSLISGVLYVAEKLRELDFGTKWKRSLFIVDAIGTNMLVGYVTFEFLSFYSWYPLGLNIAIAALVARVGSGLMLAYFLHLIEGKINLAKGLTKLQSNKEPPRNNEPPSS